MVDTMLPAVSMPIVGTIVIVVSVILQLLTRILPNSCVGKSRYLGLLEVGSLSLYVRCIFSYSHARSLPLLLKQAQSRRDLSKDISVLQRNLPIVREKMLFVLREKLKSTPEPCKEYKKELEEAISCFNALPNDKWEVNAAVGRTKFTLSKKVLNFLQEARKKDPALQKACKALLKA